MSQQFLPLLKPENIDELKSLILEIMEDNDSKLEKIIENRQTQALEQGSQFSIQDLNDLLSEQCLQKQKIVSNLSHFALSLMNTIEVLWQDNQDLQYRIRDQRQIMYLQKKQGDFLKNKLNLVYNDLHKVEEQKHAIEEYLSSIIIKHDSSFSLRQVNSKIEGLNFDQKNQQQQKIEQQYQGDQFDNSQNENLLKHQHETNNLQQQNSMSLYEKQHKNSINNQNHQMDLLEESLIKDSISVLRRFTLQDEILEHRLPILEEESQDQIKFIEKSNRFSLMHQISMQIFQEPSKSHVQHIQKEQILKPPFEERSTIRDLKISNQKVNITIATGTEFTRTRDSEKNYNEQFSMIQPSPSCTSFFLPRQGSAIMNPCLERASSTISFVTHTTKQVQTDPPNKRNDRKITMKNIDKKSVGVDSSTVMDKSMQNKKVSEKSTAFIKQKSHLSQIQVQKEEQSTNKKSFGQLFDYFTKKIVSDRIKTSHKKNDLGGFKKNKSNIQKVF